jgi:hypothetical protein
MSTFFRTISISHLCAAVLIAPVACDDGGSSPDQGTRVTDAQLCMFKVGRTRTADVVALLGPPQTSSGGADLTVYMYKFRSAQFEELVTLTFEHGTLRDVSITTVGAATPRDVPACSDAPAAEATP